MRPLPLPPRPPPRSTDLAVLGLLGLGLMAFLLTAVAPKFGEVFRQVKVPMPGSTLMVMTLSESVLADPWAAALLLLAIPAFLRDLTGRHATIARVVVPLLLIAGLGWMVLAMFQPLIGCHLSIGRP
jgi:type II secretory pathway component PulF